MGYVHDLGSWTPGFTHDLGDWTPGFTHDLGDWEPGFTHDLGSWTPGFTHDLGDWTPGFTHDLGDWEPGFTHDLGSWTPGFVHDLGTWVTGWNVYGLDEDNQRVWLFFSQDYPDSEYTDIESGREWQPDPEGGTTFTLWSSSTPDDDWYNAVASREWDPDIGGGTTFTATDASTPDEDWYNAVAGTGWVPAAEGGTTFSATTDTTPESDWYNAVASRQWAPDISGGTTFTATSSSTPDSNWYNAVASREWDPDISGGTTFTVTSSSTPDADWYNAVAGTGWVPAAGGGTTFTATMDTTPESDWYNAVASRQWDPDISGGTTFTASDSSTPDSDWYNAVASRQWAPDPDGGTTWTEADEPSSDWVNAVGPQPQFADPGGSVTETSAGAFPSDWGDSEVQKIVFPSGVTGGTWTVDGFAVAYNVDSPSLAYYLAVYCGQDVSVSGDGGGPYTVTWHGKGLQSLLSVDTSGLSFSSTIVEDTTGVVGNDEVWSLSIDHPSGMYTISTGTSSVSGYADGTLDAVALQAAFETLYGAGNVSVTLTDGDETAGTFTIEFVGALANTAIAHAPSIDLGGLASGSASLANVTVGFAGTKEVQVITLPDEVGGGTWTLAGVTLDWNADADDVQAVLVAAGQDVTVSGSVGGPFIVTWTAVGPQDLLDVANIDLQVRDRATITTINDGGTGFNLLAHYIYDTFGNVAKVVDANGATITDPSTVTNITYAGYSYDWSTDTYATINRIYDPKTGTWTRPDPKEIEAGQSNFYVYVGNNPANGTDPSGLQGPSKAHFILGKNYPVVQETETTFQMADRMIREENYQKYVAYQNQLIIDAEAAREKRIFTNRVKQLRNEQRLANDPEYQKWQKYDAEVDERLKAMTWEQFHAGGWRQADPYRAPLIPIFSDSKLEQRLMERKGRLNRTPEENAAFDRAQYELNMERGSDGISLGHATSIGAKYNGEIDERAAYLAEHARVMREQGLEEWRVFTRLWWMPNGLGGAYFDAVGAIAGAPITPGFGNSPIMTKGVPSPYYSSAFGGWGAGTVRNPKLQELIESEAFQAKCRDIDIYDCSDLANILRLKASSGANGTVVNIKPKVGRDLRVSEFGNIQTYVYHEIYMEHGFVYDLRYSNTPVFVEIYFKHLNELNPGGVINTVVNP